MTSRRTFLGLGTALLAGATLRPLLRVLEDPEEAGGSSEHRIHGRLRDESGNTLPGADVVLLQAAPDGSHMHPGWHSPASSWSGEVAYVQHTRTDSRGTFEFHGVIGSMSGSAWPVLMARLPSVGWRRVTSWRVP